MFAKQSTSITQSSPNKRLFRQMAVAAGAFCMAATCWAGRPLATEDAGVLGRGECELESFVAKTVKQDGRFFSSQVGCGIGFNTQLAITGSADRIDGTHTDGAALSGKTFLRELSDEQAGIAIAYTLLGEKELSEDLKYAATEIKVVLTAPHNGWLMHSNIGWARINANHHSRTTWALALERPNAVGPFDLMGEVYGDDIESPWMQLAARWSIIPDRLNLDASWGMQTDSMRTKQFTLGLKAKF